MRKISTIVFIIFIAFSCKDDTPVDPVVEAPLGTLELMSTKSIMVPEPSGLAFGPGKNTLLTVSDNTNQIYEMDFEGNVIRVLDYTGGDLEGVTYNPDKNLIAVVDERVREVALLDYDTGEEVGVHRINISVGAENSGLEGISYNPNNKQYYIVNETNPKLMVIWTPETDIISELTLSFANDYSGIFADSDHSLLWFLSDESEKLYKCDYNANVLMLFNLGGNKFEGVAVDNDIVYLVNDATASLNTYKIINN